MANLHDIPAALQVLIQNEKEALLRAPLTPELGFRNIADPEPVGIRIGESVTKFRGNLLAPQLSQITQAQMNADLDNSMTPKTRKVEAYTVTPYAMADTMNLNKLNNVAALIDEYTKNALAIAQQSEASIDIQARNKLMAGYLSGHTFVGTTASSTSIAVDDVTGFETVMVNGVPTAVSGSNTLAITINGTSKLVTGVAVDVSNTSRNPYGRSGVLTISVSTSVTQGQIVLATDRPRIVRPFVSGVERADMLAIASGDLWTFRQLRKAQTYLRNQGNPLFRGSYNVYCSEDSLGQLFEDAEFQRVFQGTGTKEVYNSGTIVSILGLKFITNNMFQTQAAGTTPTSAKLHFPVMVAAGALGEGQYVDLEELDAQAGGDSLLLHDVKVLNGISYIDRAALDRLGMNMTQSWFWSGDFFLPTDSLIDSTVIPSASSSRLKRAVVMPHSE